jgi:peptidoglycan/LPS O-acetylase OafA/YrhL
LFGNLTMCQTWLRIPDIEVSYWTLGVELKFYAIALAFFLLRRRMKIETFGGLWMMAIVLFRVADAALGLPQVLATPLIVDYGHLFIAGIMMFQLKFHGPSRGRTLLINAALPLQFVAAGFESMIVVTIFVMAFRLIVADKLAFLAVRPLVYLGGVSYSLYLTHGIMGHAIIIGLSQYTTSPILLMGVPIIVALAVAHVFTTRWEAPSLRNLRSWYKRHREMFHRRGISMSRRGIAARQAPRDHAPLAGGVDR